MKNLIQKLYDSYAHQDNAILTLEVVIYVLLSLSFTYSLVSSLYYYFVLSHPVSIFQMVISGLLLVIFVMQLVLMVEVKLGIYPFKDKSKKKKTNAKKSYKVVSKKTKPGDGKITKFPGA